MLNGYRRLILNIALCTSAVIFFSCKDSKPIPFKKNVTGKSGGSSTWAKMYKIFATNYIEFAKHYHKRSNVESVFSMIKARFGNNVRCKKQICQDNEILLKCLCHNLCCLVQEIFLNKIDINFKKCADNYIAHKH